MMNRRRFLASAGAAIAAPVVIGASAAEKLNLATVGSGGMGGTDLASLAEHPNVRVVALCDVDASSLKRAAKKFPEARTFSDYRKMFDAMAKDIDAVNVGIPDHMHAPVAMTAIGLGKHVYCQKPLCHEVYEARKLAEAAEKRRVVTQMGIQIHSSREYRLAVRLIQDRAIGKVKEVHSWSEKKWGHEGDRPAGADPVPPNLDWDLWLGVAPFRPFKAGAYHPGNWRKWYDFGCGTMGDMAIHILDPVATALALTRPTSVISESPAPQKESFSTKNKVRYVFPRTEYSADSLALTWYDGDFRPDSSLWPVRNLPGQGSMFVGEKGWMLLPHVGMPQLLPEKEFAGYRIPDVAGGNHWHEWVDACQGKGRTGAGFPYAGPLTEFVLLGVVANRVPGKKLAWNGEALRIEGCPEADALLRRAYRKGWRVDGL